MPGQAPGGGRDSGRGDPAQSVRVNEDPAGRLKLDEGRERGGRVGDPRSDAAHEREFPDERVRQAGRTGGEVLGRDVTADDAAPETLIDEDGAASPGRPAEAGSDTVLQDRDAQSIGAGRGLDEAELAERDPVGRDESERLRRKAAQHARDPNAVEPHEAQEQANRPH